MKFKINKKKIIAQNIIIGTGVTKQGLAMQVLFFLSQQVIIYHDS